MQHHLGVGTRNLGTNRGRQAKAHGAQTTRREEGARLLAVNMLVRPHLMLAHLGGDHTRMRVKLGRELLEHHLGSNAVGVILKVVCVERPALAPGVAGFHPLGVHRLGLKLVQTHVDGAHHVARVTHDGHLRVADLTNLGGIDVDVNDLGMRGKFAQLARHAVGEARAHRNDEVALGHGHNSRALRPRGLS